jgi:hypothetical protein
MAADSRNQAVLGLKARDSVPSGVQQQQQQSAAKAAAAAAAARQGLNEMNTAMTLNRFLTCGIVVF